jgi:hypothetical protein
MLTWKGLYELLKTETSRGPVPLFPPHDIALWDNRDLILRVLRSLLIDPLPRKHAYVAAWCILNNPPNLIQAISDRLEADIDETVAFYEERDDTSVLRQVTSEMTWNYLDVDISLSDAMYATWFSLGRAELVFHKNRPCLAVRYGRGRFRPVPNVFSGTILCRKATITFLCIRRFLDEWKKIPKDVWDLIAKRYIYSSRRTEAWFPENMVRKRRKRIKI